MYVISTIIEIHFSQFSVCTRIGNSFTLYLGYNLLSRIHLTRKTFRRNLSEYYHWSLHFIWMVLESYLDLQFWKIFKYVICLEVRNFIWDDFAISLTCSPEDRPLIYQGVFSLVFVWKNIFCVLLWAFVRRLKLEVVTLIWNKICFALSQFLWVFF